MEAHQNGQLSEQSAAASPTAVFHCLQQALKADQQTRQAAEAQLAVWESRPGYCSCLLVSLD